MSYVSLSSTYFEEWKYIDESTKHRELLLKLIEYGRNSSVEVKVVGNVRVIFSEEFCIGEGSDATRVFLGLSKDGYGKAVKRIHRHKFIQLAHHEKKILNEFNAKKSKYVVNYFYLEEDTGTEYVYLMLDLCEESLDCFVKYSTLHDLKKALPDILRQILKGLADLHSGPNPILHRDLKPSNVLRDSKSKFLIADFGISRIMKNESTTYESNTSMGTVHWIAPESYCEDSVNKARYKRRSDVYNAGMVAYFVTTKGKHPFGRERYRLDNMLNGNPVGLDEIEDRTLKDLLSWMLNLKPEDRPYSNEALKHPFLMSDNEKFEMLSKVGNLQQIKTNDPQSSVVEKLNSESVYWKSQMDWDVYDYFRTYEKNGKINKVRYTSSWPECLRFIRNIDQHWNDRQRPLPQPEPFYKIGDYRAYFLRTFPNLPVRVHAAVRSNEELKNKPELKNFFYFNESELHQ
ncbi:serine/threonine-protein kinase/endoribonuclease ire-1-like isoform X2 [Xenia sp. Carnegie-2017]|uniref:serine/threonine-protein kinase/endoribonuclease ire-1-like isoform X2 n=1 Tax=Xenia sp. Carnegie-2017 TaxID=2897299 RepID=UPI001F04A2EA|nr:serine/threonine-protein kinase/endoribonuclease ire-1-like isoform X2 [Xenia sp. Carnegie-2017]